MNPNFVKPKIYLATDHDIDPALVDADAVYVIEKLRDAGFEAYLVGGSVRDLLRKKIPKDFDISTSARPEEIKHVFQRSCILIGKRFRLAHIRFGRKIIEVSTFRSGENADALIVRDNVWGSPEEDVLRRDFTINGLFYDPATHEVIDYVGGWDDLHKHTLRTIGDPDVRFKQDPVRMIRLIKFRARFGFNIATETKHALIACREEITKSSPARILEEMLRMLESGAAAPFFHLMTEAKLLDLLFPALTHFLRNHNTIYQYLEAADQLNLSARKSPLDRSTLVSCLLFPILAQEIDQQYLSQNKIPHLGEVMMLITSITQAVITASFSHFPRRLSSSVNFILSTQYRMTPLGGKRYHHSRAFHNIREFGAALAFLKIRALVNPDLQETYTAWRNLYKQQARQNEHRRHHHHNPPPKRKRGSRRASTS